MSQRNKNTYGVRFVVMTHSKTKFHNRQEIKTYRLDTWTVHCITELELQAVVGLAVKVKVGTHYSERMPFFVQSVVTYTVASVLDLMVSYKYYCLIIDSKTVC